MAIRDPGGPMEPQGPEVPGRTRGSEAPREAGAPVHPGEPRDLDRDVDPAHPYRARQLAPYRRDAGLHDSGLTGRYPGLRGSGSRDPRVRSSGPGPGAGTEREPDRATMLNARMVLATLARPVGGWLADRVTGVPVLKWALGVVAAGAVVTAFQPAIVLATVAFLTMAAALGLGNGAIFALVGTGTPAASVGSVTGLVGAAGGLGGFLPPIVMGLVYQATGDYAIGLMLLSDVALAGLVFTAWRLGSAAQVRARSG